MISTEEKQTICTLLGSQNLEFAPIELGGNNKLFKVLGTQKPLVAKWYSENSNVIHNRLKAEWAFLGYARECKLSNVPVPIAKNTKENVAVFSYIDGSPVKETPSADLVVGAARFIDQLNSTRRYQEGLTLGQACEAQFSFSDHLKIVTQRIQRLQETIPKMGKYSEAQFLVEQMSGYCGSIERFLVETCRRSSWDFDGELPKEERCISPSDFGFHNARIDKNHRLSFVDFEYAGWDDPAKLVCDFFWQPAVKVPIEHKAVFFDAALKFSNRTDLHKERIKALDPLFGLKWCCIMMNAFLPEWIQRQSFANPDLEIAAIQSKRTLAATRQLQKIAENFKL